MKTLKLALLLGLCMLYFAGCGGGSTVSQTASVPPIEPVPPEPLTALKAVLLSPSQDPKLQSIQRVTRLQEEAPDPARHEVLIVDARPGLATDPTVTAFLAQGRSVLFLNPSEELKRSDILPHAHAVTHGQSHLFAVRRGQDRFGRPEVFLYEWNGQADLEQSAQFELDLARYLQAQSQVGDDFSPPAGLIYVTFNFSSTLPGLSLTTTEEGRKKYDTPQVTSLIADYAFQIFLENGQIATGERQWVVLETDLRASPFNSALGTSGMLAEKAGNAFESSDMGWFQISVGTSMQPANAGLFQWQQDSPPNTNNVTDVTTSLSFNINFTNPINGGGASFNFGSSTTHVLTSWLVQNLGSSTIGNWLYLNQDPYQANDLSKWTGPGFGGGLQGLGVQRDPNDLAKSEFQGDTQVAWTTQSLLTSVQSFTGQLVAQYANAWDRGGGVKSQILPQALNVGFDIDMAVVVPIPIQSLTFAPNPALPAQSPQVTGTVTLASAAPMDVTVNLSSNSQNATVLPTVTIPQGQTSAQFQILTNANGLAQGQSTVATITAFYAQGFQAQLEIKN